MAPASHDHRALLAVAAALILSALILGVIATSAVRAPSDHAMRAATRGGRSTTPHTTPSHQPITPSHQPHTTHEGSPSRRAGGAGASDTSETSNLGVSGVALPPKPSPQDVAREAGRAARAQTAKPKKNLDNSTVSTAAIKESIARLKPMMKRCYEDLLDDFPEASGRVRTTLTMQAIDGIAEVERVEIPQDESTMWDDRLNACMTRSIRQLTFPVDSDDGRMTITYPFRFSHDAKKSTP